MVESVKTPEAAGKALLSAYDEFRKEVKTGTGPNNATYQAAATQLATTIDAVRDAHDKDNGFEKTVASVLGVRKGPAALVETLATSIQQESSAKNPRHAELTSLVKLVEAIPTKVGTHVVKNSSHGQVIEQQFNTLYEAHALVSKTVFSTDSARKELPVLMKAINSVATFYGDEALLKSNAANQATIEETISKNSHTYGNVFPQILSDSTQRFFGEELSANPQNYRVLDVRRKVSGVLPRDFMVLTKGLLEEKMDALSKIAPGQKITILSADKISAMVHALPAVDVSVSGLSTAAPAAASDVTRSSVAVTPPNPYIKVPPAATAEDIFSSTTPVAPAAAATSIAVAPPVAPTPTAAAPGWSEGFPLSVSVDATLQEQRIAGVANIQRKAGLDTKSQYGGADGKFGPATAEAVALAVLAMQKIGVGIDGVDITNGIDQKEMNKLLKLKGNEKAAFERALASVKEAGKAVTYDRTVDGQELEAVSQIFAQKQAKFQSQRG